MRPDRLTAMTHFVRIVERGSLSAAARELGKTLPALSRSLRALEERLGARLLTRTTRALSLTEFGQQYYERCRRILHDVEEAEHLARDTGRVVRGQVRVTAPLLFGRLHVAPLVAPLLAQYPELRVDLQLTDRVVSMVDEGIDVSIRIGDLQDSSLVAIPLGQVRRIACAAPAYWARHGTPDHPRELAAHRCLAFRGLNQERGWLFSVNGDERHWPVAGPFASNDGAAVIAVAQAGAGVAQMMSYQIAGELAAGRLVPVLDAFAPHASPVHALYPGGRLLPARVRALMDAWVPPLRQVLQTT